MRIPLVGPTYNHPSLNVSAQRCINLFPESTEGENEDAQWILRRAPGTVLFCDLESTGACRGLYNASNNRAFSVNGARLFEVFQNGTAIQRGILNTSAGVVHYADNGDVAGGAGGNQMILVDGTNGYIFDFSTNTMTVISSGGFPAAPASVLYYNTLFLVNEGGTNRVFFSSPLDGTAWDALDFFSASANPDPVIQIAQTNGQIWLYGPNSTEVFYLTTDANNLFQQIPGSPSDIGLLAPNSLASANNNSFFLGGNKDGFAIVYMTQGPNTQTRISNIPIESAINGYLTPNDAIGFTYQKDGHYFYCLTFQNGNATWVYDISTKQWHERSSQVSGYAQRWNYVFHMFAFNKNIVGDVNRAKLFTLDENVFVEDQGSVTETLIICTRIGPQSQDPDYFNRIFRQLQVQIQSGVGTTTGQGSDPHMMLSWSDDGGHTFSNELTVSMGKIGQYNYRARWLRLGKSRLRCWKISISDPVQVVVISADVIADRCSN